MDILLTNDDGVFAPGIIALATRLTEGGHRCFVVAPDRERSSIGHAITLNRPLRLWMLDRSPYPERCSVRACDGTPSDCVVLAVEEVLPKPDILLSGINCGPNLGDDLTYSGTVSAAMEGLILGISSIAVSLNCEEADPRRHYETAAAVVLTLLSHIETTPLPKDVLLNVNVPNRPLASIRGIRVTRKGIRQYEEKITRRTDPEGRTLFSMAGRVADQLDEGSDVWAVAHGYVSVTPIHMDMTHYPSLEALQKGDLENINLR
ncbi:MAG TPA: 5'/3'-nucleotidase SurE [Synergistaceae bacterium]|nr:5'/3'-nucleotidase SurE [Synergistaceae bacterium]